MKISNDEHGTNILLVRSHQVNACKTNRAGVVPSRHHHTYEEPFFGQQAFTKTSLTRNYFSIYIFVKLLKKSVESGAIIENIDSTIIHLEIKNCYSKPTSLLSFTTK